MNGFSIQSCGGVALPAPPSALPADRPAPSPSSSPSPASAVSLDFSDLAQALEKLAQTPGIDERALTRIFSLLKQQGELLRLSSMLKASGGALASIPTDLLGQLDPDLVVALKTAFPRNANGAPATQNPAAEVQNKIAQSLQQFIASIKGAFATIPASSPQSPTPDSSAPAQTPNPPAIPGQGSVATGPAALKAGVAQFLQTQTEQLATLFQSLTAQPLAAPATAKTSASASPLPLAALAAPSGPSAPPAPELAEALRQLVATGRLAGSPLLRQEFIKATLGLVSTLLSEPAFSAPATPAQPPASQRASSSNTSALPTPAPASTPPQASLPDRAPALLQTLRALAPLLTPTGREVLARVESLLGELAQHSAHAQTPGSKSAGKLPERLAELARRGLSAELETSDLPRRLDSAIAGLRAIGLRAEILRPDRASHSLLRLVIPGNDPKAEPLPLDATGQREKARGGNSAMGPVTNPNPDSAATTPSHALKFSSAALATFITGTDRPDPESAPPSDRFAAPARPDQYTHPEAFRFAPQTQQEKSALHITAFFQTHRDEALQGVAFEPQAGESAIPSRLLLTYRPIEVIRPGKGLRPFEPAPKPQPAPETPIITIRPLEVRKS